MPEPRNLEDRMGGRGSIRDQPRPLPQPRRGSGGTLLAVLLVLALVLCVGAVLVTKTVGHHTSCRQVNAPSGSVSPLYGSDTETLCTTKPGLW
jgi:hypothetical protein